MEEQSASAETLDKINLKLLLALRPEASEAERTAALAEISKNSAIFSKLKKILGRGLVLLDF
jgi:hypothetical protein